MSTEFVDTHAHLDFPDFEDDLPRVIRRAAEAGVTQVVNVGTTVELSRKVVHIAERFDSCFATVGIHPHEADKVDPETFGHLDELARHPKVLAIGETGLDTVKNYCPLQDQRQSFRQNLELAARHNLPVVVHSREAGTEAVEIMAPYLADGLRGVLHCFTGSAEVARAALQAGMMISFTGILTFKKSHALRAVAAEVPVERVMIETDCPFCAPQGHRGKRNEPAFVPVVAHTLADIHGLSVEDVARITTRNARRFFKLPGLEAGPGEVAYRIRDSLYLNITNRCSNRCTFCVREQSDAVKGHRLALEREPTVPEVLEAVTQHHDYREVVFCGYGEPTCRYDAMMEIARALQGTTRLRLDTNGLGRRIVGRDIVGELAEVFDAVSVSLNAADAATYDRLCRPDAEGAWVEVCRFIRCCVEAGLETTSTVVSPLEGVDVEACRAVAERLGSGFRVRHYHDNRG